MTAAEQPYPIPTVQPTNAQDEYDSGDYRETFDRVLKEFNWAEKSKLAGKLIDGRYHGVAVCNFVEGGAAGPKESARLEVNDDGTITVFMGSSAVGQGVETVFAQIAADALEMPIERIRHVYHGSTSTVSDGYGAYHSRSVVMGGSALLDATEKFQAAIREAAAKKLGCDAAAVTIEIDKVSGPGGKSVALAEFAGITAEGAFLNKKHTYSFGAHAAHITVDPKIGEVRILDYVVIQDVGRAINPLTLHGQIIGSLVQGLGGAMLEHLQYDDQGQFLTGSLADYLLPTASDLLIMASFFGCYSLGIYFSNPITAATIQVASPLVSAATVRCLTGARFDPASAWRSASPCSAARSCRPADWRAAAPSCSGAARPSCWGARFSGHSTASRRRSGSAHASQLQRAYVASLSASGWLLLASVVLMASGPRAFAVRRRRRLDLDAASRRRGPGQRGRQLQLERRRVAAGRGCRGALDEPRAVFRRIVVHGVRLHPQRLPDRRRLGGSERSGVHAGTQTSNAVEIMTLPVLKVRNCRWIDVPGATDARGSVNFLEPGKGLDFEPKRLFYLHHVAPGQWRGPSRSSPRPSSS